jgi:hypothetical protein
LKDRLKLWAKRHKKALIITTTVLSISGIIIALLIVDKKHSIVINPKSNNSKFNILNTPATTIFPSKSILDKNVTMIRDGITNDVAHFVKTPFERKEHIRRLPYGWQPSKHKIITAKEKGIQLKPGETLVNSCIINKRIS